ncbi:hypothetical protein H9P43_008977 [Blastocladiella emersonii ATCC 22665]|nr:hypothetical protein H9P43_008977 [Blastocladiella emersonii ATCC 22665]
MSENKDRESFILATSAEKAMGLDLTVGKADPLREPGKIAFFEFLAVVTDPNDGSKPTLKHLDGKMGREQIVVILDSRSGRLLSANSGGQFATSDDGNSDGVLWRLTKDPSSQLAVSLTHFKSNKRLVIERSKSGRFARNSPLVARLKGDAVSGIAGEDAIFTLVPERAANFDLQTQSRGLQTFKEKLKENAGIVSPFAMMLGSIVGVAGFAHTVNKDAEDKEDGQRDGADDKSKNDVDEQEEQEASRQQRDDGAAKEEDGDEKDAGVDGEEEELDNDVDGADLGRTSGRFGDGTSHDANAGDGDRDGDHARSREQETEEKEEEEDESEDDHDLDPVDGDEADVDEEDDKDEDDDDDDVDVNDGCDE